LSNSDVKGSIFKSTSENLIIDTLHAANGAAALEALVITACSKLEAFCFTIDSTAFFILGVTLRASKLRI
jgi:hypothetical protein